MTYDEGYADGASDVRADIALVCYDLDIEPSLDALRAEVARLRGWKNRALYAETRMTTDGDHIAELDAEVARLRTALDEASARAEEWPQPCGCRERCGDLPQEDDDPYASCKGLPR